MATFPNYATSLPGIPRSNGVATVTVGGTVPADVDTVVHFVTKEELASKFSGLGAKDAERDSVNVKYEQINGAETRVLYASLGPAASIDLAAIKRAANAVVGKLRSLKVERVVLHQPVVADVPAGKVTEGLVQAAALTNFHFDRYITMADKIPFFLKSIHVSLPSSLSEADASAAAASGKAAAILAGECSLSLALCLLTCCVHS